MGFRTFLSKLCLYTFVLGQLFHGILLFAFAKPFLTEIWNVKTLSYFGNELAVEYVFINIRMAGLIKALTAIGAYCLGPSKMCFCLLMIACLAQSIVVASHVQFVVPNVSFQPGHVEILKLRKTEVIFFTIVTFLGIVFASGKEERHPHKYRRSRSIIVNALLVLSVLVEVIFFSFYLQDPIGTFLQVQPKLDEEKFEEAFSSEGKAILVYFIQHSVAYLIPLSCLVVSLKPTTYAIVISYLFHSGIAYNVFLSKANVEANMQDATNAEIYNAYFQTVAIIHCIIAAILVLTFFLELFFQSKSKQD